MSIFEIMSPEFRAQLPGDDDEAAFIMIAERAITLVEERHKRVDDNDAATWQLYHSAQCSAVNVILNAARKFEIEPFASMVMPIPKNFGTNDYDQFRHDLEGYLTQSFLHSSKVEQRASVLLTAELKHKIRDYLTAIRGKIETSDLDERKKATLLDKLAEFERELEGRRLKFWAITWITIQVLMVPGGLGGSADMIGKLLQNITIQAAEAHSKEVQDQAIPSLNPPKLLVSLAATPPEPKPQAAPQTFPADLDDEIPF